MWKTIITVGLTAVLAAGSVACGAGEGDSCSTQSDCSDQNLTCQPIDGRGGDFCCPTPPQSSSKTSCQPTPLLNSQNSK